MNYFLRGITLLIFTMMSAMTSAQTFIEQGETIIGGINIDSRSVSLADIDNDGDLDLFYQTTAATTDNRLLKNELSESGTATFTNISDQIDPPDNFFNSWSAAWGDPDADGDVDVFVGQTNPGNETGDFFRNNGNGFFEEVSADLGLDDPGFHQNVAWSDVNNDGLLDLLIAMEGPTEKHEVYLQQPDGTFIAFGSEAGFQQIEGVKAYGMAVGDADNDGDIDVYISTCRSDNRIRNNFYRNLLSEFGTFRFFDIADVNGTQNFENSYGTEFHDFDDDGDLDLFMTGADAQRSRLWRNDGIVQFTDVDEITSPVKVFENRGGDFNGSRAIDYDNDGDLDVYFHDHLAANGQDSARTLYRNDGDWDFTDVTEQEGLLNTNEGGYDSAWGDFDLDGDLDLFTSNDAGSPERVFVSYASENGNHWLFIRLKAAPPNPRAIGAQVYATIGAGTPDERTLRRDANSNAGTFNQSDTPVHFGLGPFDVVDELRIVWPGGHESIIRNLSADQHLEIEQVGKLALVRHILDVEPLPFGQLESGDYNDNDQLEVGDVILAPETLY
jgi:hypothetical protein